MFPLYPTRIIVYVNIIIFIADIKKNAEFRGHFQQMCATIGVDPLASSKGFWSEMLGVGDYYYELGE